MRIVKNSNNEFMQLDELFTENEKNTWKLHYLKQQMNILLFNCCLIRGSIFCGSVTTR